MNSWGFRQNFARLRKFVDDMHELFAIRRSKKQAWKIWRRMRCNKSYLNNEHLKKALDVLTKQNMEKLLHYLDGPTSTRYKTRTNNHVERCNRVLSWTAPGLAGRESLSRWLAVTY
jgi:hypothetical protein